MLQCTNLHDSTLVQDYEHYCFLRVGRAIPEVAAGFIMTCNFNCKAMINCFSLFPIVSLLFSFNRFFHFISYGTFFLTAIMLDRTQVLLTFNSV
jgi:hypothetical protein